MSAISEEFQKLSYLAYSLQSELQNKTFNRSAIRENPVIRVLGRNGRVLLIPMPELLMARITDGLYYDIVSNDGARNEAGIAFEDLSREMLNARLSSGWSLVNPETIFGKGCCDIGVVSPHGEYRVLIECKARRIARRVSSSPIPWKDARKDYEDIIKGITQIWRTAHLLVQPSKDALLGTLLTLDPWMSMATYGDELFEEARALAQKKWQKDFLEIPICFVSSDEFERVSARLETKKLIEKLTELSSRSKSGYVLKADGSEKFGTEGNRASDPFDYSNKLSKHVSWWNAT